MRCLIVLAHPLAESLNHRFASYARQRLEAAGHEVTLLDLYAEDFDPRLTENERAAYYAARHDHSPIQREADLLREAEALLLVFPTWWFGPPAILKGWIDRIFAPGIAFDHAADFGPITPRLVNLRKVFAVTTLGSPWWVDLLVMRRPVRRILKTAVLAACAPQAALSYLPFHAAERPRATRIERFEQRLARALSSLR